MKHAFLAFALVAACSDDPAPLATVEAATPDRLTMSDDGADDLTITVKYEDADGDLGGGVADVFDCRNSALLTSLPIPQIAPDGVVDEMAKITGRLELHVNDVGEASTLALPAECSDLGIAAQTATTTVFCIVLVDAAGHRGGGDCTGTITLFQ